MLCKYVLICTILPELLKKSTYTVKINFEISIPDIWSQLINNTLQLFNIELQIVLTKFRKCFSCIPLSKHSHTEHV